ncbi:MAG: hypothetical protein HY340_03000 [Candidatus Kerfeldbacteria bacterium]|nr:hypothetical protein [Candidatus Kerfeldbacteria bacterium]
MKKSSKGTWKKERAVGRKYSKSDSHKAPKAHSRSKYWVGGYTRRGRRVAGGFRRNAAFGKK